MLLGARHRGEESVGAWGGEELTPKSGGETSRRSSIDSGRLVTVCLRGGVELGFAAIEPISDHQVAGERDDETGAPAPGADECAVGGDHGRPEAVRSRRRFAGLLGRGGVGGTWRPPGKGGVVVSDRRQHPQRGLGDMCFF